MKNLAAYVVGSTAYERKRLFLLTASFFCVVGCFTIFRELRDVLFIALIGRNFIQYAQIGSMVMLIPALFIYARLVDRFTKYQLLYIYSTIFSVGGLVIAWFMGDARIGLPNTAIDSSRIFGWLVYLFVESYAPFMISLLLAFINSVTPPKEAPESYSIIIAGSKLGGVACAALGWLFLAWSPLNEITNHRILMAVAAALVGLVPLCISLLHRYVPERYMHGYEASYQYEQKEKLAPSGTWYQQILEGPLLMIRFPYVLGIFALVFCWEVVSAVINFNRLCTGTQVSENMTDLTCFLLQQILWVHAIAFVVALVGVSSLLKLLGEKRTLIAVPVLTGLFLAGYFLSDITWIVSISYILIRGLNYSLALSVREVLYIPTTKEVRFKSKSWIDAFGAKFARCSGAVYNLGAEAFAQAFLRLYSLAFCGVIVLFWFIAALLMGKKFESSVRNNQVIGI